MVCVLYTGRSVSVTTWLYTVQILRVDNTFRNSVTVQAHTQCLRPIIAHRSV